MDTREEEIVIPRWKSAIAGAASLIRAVAFVLMLPGLLVWGVGDLLFRAAGQEWRV